MARGVMTFPAGGVPTGRSVHCWPDAGERFIVGFYYRGLRGVAQFWFVTADEILKTDAYDLGFHSHSPMYEGHTSMGRPCETLGCPDCFYEGTSLGAGELLREFREQGPEAVWRMLESIYRQRSMEMEPVLQEPK